MDNNKLLRLSNFLKLFGLISAFICIYAGLQTFLFFEGSVPGATLDFYRSVGLFFIGFGLFIGSLLWGIAFIVDRT
jgi:hypothetical protein